MRKLLFFTFIVMTLVACWGKKSQTGTADVVNADSMAAADVVTTAPAELWTVEAVEAQIRKIYDRLNEMDKYGVINIVTLEDEFCSSYYLNLRNAIHDAVKGATNDSRMFFGDEECFRFLAGMQTPLVIDNIKADLLSGDQAQAQVRFKGADEEKGFMRFELEFENGAWRVKNFDQPEAFGPGGILKMLEDFANEHGIRYEGTQSGNSAMGAEEWDVSVRTTDLNSDKPRYEAIFRDSKGNTIQVAEGYTVDYPQDMLEPFGNVWQADVNFDGHTDIMICLGLMPASDQVITNYDAWLYNQQTGKFVYHKGFRDIANPEVDSAARYVKSHYMLRDGKTKHYTALTIQPNGTQKKVKEWEGM